MYIPELILKYAVEQPDKEATIFEERSLSYRQFSQVMEDVGAYFQSQGYKRGDVIGLYLSNSDYFLACLYGLQLAGYIAMPVNIRLSKSEVEYIFNHSEAVAVITEDEFMVNLKDIKTNFKEVIELGKETFKTKILNNTSLQFNSVDLKSEDTAVIMYTSGTTGKPKGVMLTNKNIKSVSEIWQEAMSMTKDDRLLISTPLFHCAASHVFVAPMFYVGATIIVEKSFSKTSTINLLESIEPTIFFGVPSMYTLLLNLPNIKNIDMSSLRLFGYGASPMPYEILRQLKESFPNVKVQNLYGQTENSPAATTLLDAYALDKVGSVGQALPQTEVKVVSETGKELPKGQIGEIITRGPQVMKGYLKDELETSKALKDGWLYTGDLGKFDEEDFLYIVDRKNDLLIRGGENIYPIEIEEVLYQLPDVYEAAVIGIPHEVYNEVPKAFIVLKEGRALAQEKIFEYCQEKLAHYKVPTKIQFISELPRNASGKVLKHLLKSDRRYNS